MKYKIVFDTQAVWQDFSFNELFNDSILNVKVFLKKYNIEDAVLCLPDMVIEERIQQAEERAQLNIADVNKKLEDLKALGYANRKIKAQKEHRLVLRKKTNEYLLKHSIELIKIPKLDAKKIVDRSIKKVKPFNDKKSGFKDTVILFSLIEDARNQRGQISYILITNNTKDFTEGVRDEFKKLTNQRLYLVDDIESLKSLLDELIPLRLALGQLYKTIKEKVLERTGTLTKELNKFISNRESNSLNRDVLFGYSDGLYSISPMPDRISLMPDRASAMSDHEKLDNKLVRYDFLSLIVDNISEIDKVKFKVEGKLIARSAINQNGSRDSLLTSSYHGLYTTEQELDPIKTFGFVLEYDKSEQEIYNISFYDTYSPLICI